MPSNSVKQAQKAAARKTSTLNSQFGAEDQRRIKRLTQMVVRRARKADPAPRPQMVSRIARKVAPREYRSAVKHSALKKLK